MSTNALRKPKTFYDVPPPPPPPAPPPPSIDFVMLILEQEKNKHA